MLPIRDPSMLRALATITAALTLAGGAGAELLPRPAELEPNVRFWTRIYSEVDGNGGLIHDSEELGVVYETISFPPGLSSRSRERRVEHAKNRIRAALRHLGQGKRSGLSDFEARVLARWPEGVSNATLRAAAGRVRFQLGQADKFRAGLVRSVQWRDYVLEVLQKQGVPVELVALPHVESSYNPTAYSRVGAAGLWQFTRGTGRRFLRVDTVVDERMDPYRATEAAARLLQDNYRQLDSWPLAITGYNHGVAGMARAVRKLGTRDIAVISRRYQSRSFGFASRNFYAEFLAALDVDRNATRYFGALTPEQPVEYDLIELDHFYPASTLARAIGVDKDLLRRHNPALRPAVWDGPKYAPRGFTLRVPRGAAAKPVQLALADVPANQRFASQHRDRYYKVKRGDALSTIARRHHVSISELVALNHLRSRHNIRAGQVLILPDHGRGGSIQVARQEPPTDDVYRVQRGDTLSVIAARYGVSQTALARENGLRNRHMLHVGQSLRLPGQGTRVATAPKPSPPPEPEPPAPQEPVEVAAEQPIVVASVAPEPTLPAPRAAEPPEPEPELVAEPEPVAEAEPEPVAEAEPEPVAEAELELVTEDDLEPEPESPLPTPSAEPAPEPTRTAGSADLPSPDPSNYAVTADHRIVIQGEETLGHYAEWLEIRASDLRRLNGMRYGTPLVIGRTVRLDFRKVSPDTFEQRRLAYHQAIQEDFFSAYAVTGTTDYVLQRGESLWYLAERKFRVPVWLLRQYNPDLDFGSLQAGARMVVPDLEPRAG
jgi:membrane-bound lytic murein transglycosylase D